MILPKIGDRISTPQGRELCRYFNLGYLVARIEANMSGYLPWQFDGCSMLPNGIIGFVARPFWKKIVRECALPHDLAYAYGDPGNARERKDADLAFRDSLEDAGMFSFFASRFYDAVRIGGAEELGLSFTWAFARKSGGQKNPNEKYLVSLHSS